MRVRAVFLIVMTAGALAGQEEHGFTPFQIERGEQMFIARCAICHGPDGDGIPGVDLASGKFRHVVTQRDLMRVIQNGIPGTPMPPGNYSPQQLQTLVAYLYSMKASAPGLVPKLAGDAERGKEIFEERGHCFDCHRVNDSGKSFLGPNLGDIGAIRRSASLFLSLSDPSAEIRSANRTVRIVLKDGSTILARLLNQDTESLQILTAEGNLRSLSKDDMKEFTIMKESPMPSYKEKLNNQEIADIVAYLTTLKGTGR